MSKTLAIWFEPSGEKKLLESELHVNFWKLPDVKATKGKFHRFVDLGLKIPEGSEAKALYIGIPDGEIESSTLDYNLTPYNPIEEDQLKLIDLGAVICQETLLQAVFNEDYQKRLASNVRYSEIYKAPVESEFYIFHIEKSDIQVEHKNGYQIFKIDLAQPPGSSYFRFRLMGDRVEQLFSEFEEPSNARLQSAFSSTEIIDFRVNEKRNIEKRFLVAEMNKGSFEFTKFHFFFMCSSREEVFFSSHGPVNRCRTLEKVQWAKYINVDKVRLEPKDKKTHILVYQWSFKDKNYSHINAMIKTQYEQNNRATILRYLIILAIITILVNLVSNGIYDGVKYLTTKNSIKSTQQDPMIEKNRDEGSGGK